MCQIFAGQAPAGYSYKSRSIRLGGHATSIRLEGTFWKMLDEIAEDQEMTTPRFISTIYDEVLELHGSIANFTSLLRCACMLYLKQPTEVMAMARGELESVRQ